MPGGATAEGEAQADADGRITAVSGVTRTEMHLGDRQFTRVALATLQERLHADNAEITAVIVRLHLQDELQRSQAYLNCPPDDSQCRQGEFGNKPEKPQEQPPVAQPPPAAPPAQAEQTPAPQADKEAAPTAA